MIIRHDTPQHQPEDQIPEELKRHQAWMGTRFETRPGKPGKLDKPPHRVRNGLPVVKAAKTDPKNRATFEEALAALERGDVDAIGFVFTEDDPFTVVDFDDVLDPETGEIHPLADEVVATFPTYWEVSTRGTGLHGICIGIKPGTDCKKEPVELYDGISGARFVVLTGRTYGAASPEVCDCSEQVNALYRRLFPEKPQSPRRGAATRTGATQLTGEELLGKARKAKTGAKFRQLYDVGDTSDYKSASEADFSLINNLIFWTAGDEDMVVELFKSSALFRPPPEKDRGYVERSVKRAISGYTGTYYRPRVVREKSTREQEDILTPYLELLLDASRWKGQTGAAAFKAYTALILQAVENGIATDAEQLRIGIDIRSLAERSGVSRKTLQRSALPFLWHKDRRLIQWKREERKSGGFFILPRPAGRGPKDVVSAPSKETTQYFTGGRYGTGLDALRKLIRMRTGYSITGNARVLGDFEKVTRLGMVPMFVMVVLTAAPRGLKMEELVERTGRQRRYVRGAVDKLIAKDIVKEPRRGYFTLAAGFWAAWEKELNDSYIFAAEQAQRKRHQKERREHKKRSKANRAKWVSSRDKDVIELDAKRRRKLDRQAAFEQPTEKRHLTERQIQEREERAMHDAYDRMCQRVQDRLAAETKGAVS